MAGARLARCFAAFVGLFWLVTVQNASLAAADAPPFEWNVLFNQWQILGPIPKLDRERGELDRELVADEAHLRPGEPLTIAGREFQWQSHHSRTIPFLVALEGDADAKQYALAYAYTEFTSDADQDAVLAVGFDDGVVVWLNGEEVLRKDTSGAARLDQATANVRVKQGVNTLLAKISQGYGEWHFLARLRPPALDEPLLVIQGRGDAEGDFGRMPNLTLELLDDAGRVIDTWRASGGRDSGMKYPVYAAEPQPAPAKLRLRFDEPGFAPVEETFDWSAARDGKAAFTLRCTEPIRVRVVDDKTGEPVAGALVQLDGRAVGERTDAEGRSQFKLTRPLFKSVDALAAGYEKTNAPIAWPPSRETVVRLKPGGHVLRGRVLASDGRPLEGARVRASGRSSFDVTTDADGRFEVLGLRGEQGSIYPTIVHPDFVAKDSFALPLDDDGITEVEWQLEPAAVVVGRVTAKDDGRPLAGITITAGTDRFASNNVNPSTKTDADGRYRLGGVQPGQALVHAFSPDFAPAMQSTSVALGNPATLDFELEPGQPVTGRVTDPEGNPVSGVWIVTDTWNGARMFLRETRTDDDGRYTLPAMPSTPTVTNFLKQGYVSIRDRSLVGGEHCDVTLAPVVEHTAKVRLADTGKAPDSLVIQIGYQWQGNDRVSWQDIEQYDRSARYDASQGMVRIRRDEPSTARISYRLRAVGYRDAVIDSPAPDAPAERLEIVLEKTPTVAGRVVDADTGEPVEGVIVALVGTNDPLRFDHYVNFDPSLRALDRFSGVRTTTAADGSFELPEIDDSTDVDLVLIRKGAGFHYIRGARAVLEGEDVELPMPRPATVEGRALVAGEPVADEAVHLMYVPTGTRPHDWNVPFGFGGQVKTDSDGRFRFPGIGPGLYQVSRVRSFDNPLGGGSMSMYLTSDKILVLPGETVTHDIVQPAGHAVTGQTLDKEGQPLGSCVVTVFAGNDQRERVEAVMTDADGNFAIRHLQPGRYHLSATHYDFAAAQCGLGTEGATGTTNVTVDGDTTATIKLAPNARVQIARAAESTSLVGSVPPDFGGQLFDRDEPFQLSDHFGKVVAIDFWATWCGPCMAVLPEVKSIYEKYKDSNDFVLVTVSLDQDEESLRNGVKEHGLEFPIIYAGRDASQSIAQAFGVTGIPSSFVIGRDGRFAADKMHGSQLAAAVEAALKLPRDPAFAEGVKPARLTVKLTLDGEDTGIPDASIELVAVDPSGKVVREETIRTPGQASRFVWLYPPLAEGGEIRVAAAAEGIQRQQKIVSQPESSAEVTFAFSSPRLITGTVAVDDGQTPVAGIEVTAIRNDMAFRRSATTDAAGRFEIPALPGSYFVMATANDQFAPIANERATVEVEADADPEPTAVAACRTVTVHGTVTNEDGTPAEGAEVRTAAGKTKAFTDAEGRFELAGVPSRGQVVLYAILKPNYATATLDDCDGSEPLALVLGKPESRGGSRLTAGSKVPKLRLATLDHGEPTDWQPAADRDALVVFAALWHPAGRALVERAQAWAEEHQADLAIVSVDWSLAQARREAARLAAESSASPRAEIYFAGPGGLAIADDWALGASAQAYCVAPDGKIRTAPPPGELP